MRFIDANNLIENLRASIVKPPSSDYCDVKNRLITDIINLVKEQKTLCCDNCYWNKGASCTGATVGGVCEMWRDNIE